MVLPMSIEGMSREQRRMLRKMGAVNEQGAPVRTPRTAPTTRPARERTTPAEFVREVRGELRKVAWPTRQEVRVYSIVVLITVILFTLLVFGLDFAAGRFLLGLFNK
jgi:preprotein translocase subunit SecE